MRRHKVFLLSLGFLLVFIGFAFAGSTFNPEAGTGSDTLYFFLIGGLALFTGLGVAWGYGLISKSEKKETRNTTKLSYPTPALSNIPRVVSGKNMFSPDAGSSKDIRLMSSISGFLISLVMGVTKGITPTRKFLLRAYGRAMNVDSRSLNTIMPALKNTFTRYGITTVEAKNVVSRIRVGELSEGVFGEYAPETKEIFLDLEKNMQRCGLQDVRSTILHETTHAYRFYTRTTAMDMLDLWPASSNDLAWGFLEDIEESLTDIQAYRYFPGYIPDYLNLGASTGDRSLDPWLLKQTFGENKFAWQVFRIPEGKALKLMKTSTRLSLSRRVLSSIMKISEIADKFAPVLIAIPGFLKAYSEYGRTGRIDRAAMTFGRDFTVDYTVYRGTSYLIERYGPAVLNSLATAGEIFGSLSIDITVPIIVPRDIVNLYWPMSESYAPGGVYEL